MTTDKCTHEWGTDGQHSNEFCKKCFISKETFDSACQNTGCGQYVKGLPGNCQLHKVDAYKAHCLTTTPTVSITKEELEALRINYDLARDATSEVLGENEQLLSTINELQDLKSDMEAQYQTIMSEECAPEEHHCTCVGVLRVKVLEQAKVIEEARELLGDIGSDPFTIMAQKLFDRSEQFLTNSKG